MSAKYTVVLNDLLRDEKTKGLINEALSHYPMYTPISKNEYIPKVIPTREELNQKILNHYKYREIGVETVGRFIDELDITMCEIMPYYNQLMFTQDQDFNIIYNVDYQRTIDTTKDGEKSENVSGETSSNGENESTNTSTTTGSTTNETTGSTTNNTSANSNDSSTINSTVNHNNKNVQSETPSNDVIGITADKIESVSYADKVSWNKDTNTDNSTTTGESNSTTTGSSNSTTTGESESTSSNTGEIKGSSSNSSEMTSITTGTTKDIESTLETTKGNFGVVSAQDLISKYRDIILNIEQMVINDVRLKELFMLVY